LFFLVCCIVFLNIDLILNGNFLNSPNIFIFIDRKLFYIWSIQIDETIDIYVKDPEKVRQENIQKENLWKLYLKGHVSINEEIN